MGKPVKVNGLFSIRLDVIDRSGKSIGTLTSGTPEPTAVIFIENISGYARSVKFVNTLPNGTTFVEFTAPGGTVSAGRWADQIDNIPDRATRDRRCALQHNSGTDTNHPIQCDEIEQVQGRPPPTGSIRTWNKETHNLPFDHLIDIYP